MSHAMRAALRRRLADRWIRREVSSLVREAESFDCPHVRAEADRLSRLASSLGSLSAVRLEGGLVFD